MTPQPLSPRQQEVYTFLGSYIREHGYPPTIREIGQHLRMVSPNGVKCHLRALQRKGWIRVQPHEARAITLLVGEWPWRVSE